VLGESSAAGARETTEKRRMSRYVLQEHIAGWLMASPWIIGFLVFTIGPMLASVYLAFTDYDILKAPRWVGTANFERMLFADARFWKALQVTTVYAILSVPLHLVFGLAIALLLNARVRGLQWYRTIYYLPAVLSGVAVAMLWRWIFAADFGIINVILSFVGISGPAWLSDENWALPAFVLMSLWGVGGGMVIYLAGLQGVPTDLYEAAEVDGATTWDRFWNVTLPMISPVLFFQLVTGIIGALQIFTQSYIMTSGGPNDATLFYMLYLWQNAFRYFRMGYASALAWVIFFYILGLTILVFRSSRSWVYYEGELRGRQR